MRKKMEVFKNIEKNKSRNKKREYVLCKKLKR